MPETKYCGWVLVKMKSGHKGRDKAKQVAKKIKQKYTKAEAEKNNSPNWWYAVRADRIVGNTDEEVDCIVVPAVLVPHGTTPTGKDIWPEKVEPDINNSINSAWAVYDRCLMVLRVPDPNHPEKDKHSGHHPVEDIEYAHPDPDPNASSDDPGERPENPWG